MTQILPVSAIFFGILECEISNGCIFPRKFGLRRFEL